MHPYVDDIINSSLQKDDIATIIHFITSHFETTHLGTLKLYLGINITRDSDGVFYMDQKDHLCYF